MNMIILNPTYRDERNQSNERLLSCDSKSGCLVLSAFSPARLRNGDF